MSPRQRRLFHAVTFEAVGILVVGLGLALLSTEPAGSSTAFAALGSVVAVAWNYVYNWGFEAWESRQAIRGRSTLRRAVHAIGFEAGLSVILTPVLAWWIGVGIVEAFLTDLALILLFMVYAFLFNLAFDKVFGLPESAR